MGQAIRQLLTVRARLPCHAIPEVEPCGDRSLAILPIAAIARLKAYRSATHTNRRLTYSSSEDVALR